MIFVFKTTVSNKRGIKIVKPLLDGLVPTSKWNFDLQDCDHILRIDSQKISSGKVIEVLKLQGFECEELE